MVVSREMRKLGRRAWQHRLVSRRAKLTGIAGKYSTVNVQLFKILYFVMTLLQCDKGMAFLLLDHMDPLMQPHMFGSTTRVAACLNLPTLMKALICMDCMHLISFVSSIPRSPGGVGDDPQLVFLPDRPEHGAIIVRKAADRQHDNAFNPVTLSFFAQSYEAVRKVQGLLLLLGEPSTPVPTGGSPNVSLGKINGWQDEFKGRGVKPDVEVHLDGMHTWLPVPPDFLDTPLTSPAAWQTLENVFQRLEVHPEVLSGSVRASDFNPAGPTVFGTLRVHFKFLKDVQA